MAAGRPPRSLPQKVGILRQITIRAARPGVTSKRFLLLPKPPLYNGGLGGKDSMEAALWKVPRILPANSNFYKKTAPHSDSYGLEKAAGHNSGWDGQAHP